MPIVDGSRLLDDLTALRAFGATGTGVIRPTFSDADMEARRWLRHRMEDAGLDAAVDGFGNVVGRSRRPGPALIVGSHSDTQPRGGWLDGALGVIYGIEVARALSEDPATADLPVDAVAWSDEEGTYTSCLGSKSWCGVLTDADLAATNAAGESVTDARSRVGLADTEPLRYEPDRHVGYLEAHIEQGPYLEEAGERIGVVTSIVGIRGMTINFVGEQNHAGTTPMPRRRDAGVALFEFATRARERIADIASDATVWTFGDARLDPGAPSIIPGRAELILQFRDPDDAVLDGVQETVVALASEMTAEGVVDVRSRADRDPIHPTRMDPDLRRHLAAAAEARSPGRWREMPSAAGHDPMVISHHLPCGMLFIPSIGGISHDFAEDSHTEDIVLGCQVLADATVAVLRSV